VPIDLGHFAHRFVEPFNPESRFYWPWVIALGVALLANIAWYYARTNRQVAPAEHAARPWAFWANVLTLVWVMVLLIAKVPFVGALLSFAVNGAILVYLYVIWLPPLEAEWVRERRRARYLPKPKKKRRR
jgi:hypothetical protein